MFTKRKKPTLEQGQTEFNNCAYQVGCIDFQIGELQTSKNKIMSRMQQLEKMASEELKKRKQMEVMQNATTLPKEEEDADEPTSQVN